MEVRTLAKADVELLATVFTAMGWRESASLFVQYFRDQQRGEREVLVAWDGETFLGYVTVQWKSDYPPFRSARIPEIVDLNVLPAYQRRGVGRRLLDEAERLIARHSPRAGISVGVSAEFGRAQRMYVIRGYVPDGRGITYRDRPVDRGEWIRLDDELAIHLVKELAPKPPSDPS